MTEIWITEDGRVRETSMHDGAGYALRAFGLAKVVRKGDWGSLIWDVEGIAPEALLALRKLVSEDEELRRVDLRFNYGGWVEETFDSRWDALDRIEQVMAYAEYRPPDQIRVQRQPINGLATNEIRSLVSVWGRRDGTLTPEGLAELQSLSPRVLVFDDLRYQHIGERSMFVSVFGPDTAMDCLGRSYEYDPARGSFGKSVCSDYRDVLKANEPSYHHVCAPVEFGKERNWLIYQRLIAPFKLPDGRPILVVLCDPTQHVSIPFLRGEMN